jgi:hypothetical protein
MNDLAKLEELFNRFKILQSRVGSLAAIVQNPMVVNDEELLNWKQEMAVPQLIEFNQLITDVLNFYRGLPSCLWCGMRHPGGPEYCQR